MTSIQRELFPNVHDAIKDAGSWGGLPAVWIKSGDLPDQSGQAWRALERINDPPFLFVVDGHPHWIEARDGEAFPVALTIDRMRHLLSQCAEWYSEKKGRSVPALPPKEVVQDLLATPNPPIPTLKRIVAVPVFGPDGTICTESGYHPGARTFHAPSRGCEIPAVSENPAPQEVEQANKILDEILVDFPFASEADRAHAIEMFLLPFARNLILGPTPLHLINKPSPGSGGTLLAQVLTLPSRGRPAPLLSEARSEEEWHRRIFAKLRTLPSHIVLDNLHRRLASPALCSAITGEYVENRVIRTSEVASAPVRCVWVAIGNEVRLSGEMRDRCVLIELNPGPEPHLRTDFRHPLLLEWAHDKQGLLAWAGLTLIQAWIAAGRPRGSRRHGRFPRWAEVMGGILETVGIRGFLDHPDDNRNRLTQGEKRWITFFDEWWDWFGHKPVATSDLFDLTAGGAPVDLGMGREQSQRVRLGKALSRISGHRIGDFEVEDTGKKQGRILWQLHRTNETRS